MMNNNDNHDDTDNHGNRKTNTDDTNAQNYLRAHMQKIAQGDLATAMLHGISLHVCTFFLWQASPHQIFVTEDSMVIDFL